MIKRNRKQAGIKTAIAFVLVGAFFAGAWATATPGTKDGVVTSAPSASEAAQWPVTFEANQGQAPPSTQYIVRTPGATALLEPTGVQWIVAPAPTEQAAGPVQIAMRFAAGNPAPETATLGYSSYYGGIGNDAGSDVDVGRLLGTPQPLVAFTGSTSGNFPVSGGAADTTYGGGTSDGWVLVCTNVC